ncbi:MAG: cytochrome c oxidase subunit 2A [Bacillota bacterium]|nr:cytochrome c oxidase subunit 2A [Bacillota bacterium]MDP4170876.1 cytochrome c oxidase subunit 2A [Bacillota bacterium]
MAKTEPKGKKKIKDEENSSLKGTLVSVLFLGIFVIVTWVSVYFLFLNRF